MKNSELKNSANSSKKKYGAPTIEDLGNVAEMTRNGFSQGNDVGAGKSGITS
jgi:hypothetical protein